MTYLRFPWATSNGDKVEPPAEEQVDDSVSYEEGFSARYSEDPATSGTARRIERNEYNGALFRYSTEIQQYQENGFPDFIPSGENGGSPFSYPLNAILRQGTSIFQSNTAANVTTPPDASWDEISNTLKTNIPTQQTFTANGTWNRPTGVKYIVLKIIGGGGGGGSTSSVSNRPGGGGGGGYIEETIDVTSIASASVVIGAAGAAASAGNNNGGNGGNTVWNGTLTASGGDGGLLGGSASGIITKSGRGGAVSGGSANSVSAVGDDGGPPANSVDTASGHGGGNTLYGINEGVTFGAGDTAEGHGVGGSGSGAVTSGGAGSAGVVMVTEYL
jgi:hypothetical protein